MGAGEGRSPPTCSASKSLMINLIFFPVVLSGGAGRLQSKQSGGMGGGLSPPICRASESLMVNLIFFAFS